MDSRSSGMAPFGFLGSIRRWLGFGVALIRRLADTAPEA